MPSTKFDGLLRHRALTHIWTANVGIVETLWQVMHALTMYAMYAYGIRVWLYDSILKTYAMLLYAYRLAVYIYIYIGNRLGDYFCIVYITMWLRLCMYDLSLHINILYTYTYTYICICLNIYTCSNLADVHSPVRKRKLVRTFFLNMGWPTMAWSPFFSHAPLTPLVQGLYWPIRWGEEERRYWGNRWIVDSMRSSVFDQTNMRSPGTCTRHETYMYI